MLCPAHMLGDAFPISHSSSIGTLNVECRGLPVRAATRNDGCSVGAPNLQLEWPVFLRRGTIYRARRKGLAMLRHGLDLFPLPLRILFAEF